MSHCNVQVTRIVYDPKKVDGIARAGWTVALVPCKRPAVCVDGETRRCAQHSREKAAEEQAT